MSPQESPALQKYLLAQDQRLHSLRVASHLAARVAGTWPNMAEPEAQAALSASELVVQTVLADLQAGGLLRLYKPPLRPGQRRPPSPEKLRLRRQQAAAMKKRQIYNAYRLQVIGLDPAVVKPKF